MLTNMRNHILTHGYDYCPREHYHQLANERLDILSRAIVYDKIDIQSAFIATHMFSRLVEDFFHDKSWNESADFVQTDHQWHRACNMRGISADMCVRSLFAMHKFLMKDVDFDNFPPDFGRYVKGMPILMFEAILQNISTRTQLYQFANGGNSNARSISTLSNESFFSDLTRFDKEGHSYSKACNVLKVMGQVVTVNYFKHNPEKSFALHPTMKGTYPVHLLDDDQSCIEVESAQVHNGMYHDHFFDCINSKPSSFRHCEDDISKRNAPLCRVPGVHRFFRTNENEILAEHHAGYAPKGFTKELYKHHRNFTLY